MKSHDIWKHSHLKIRYSELKLDFLGVGFFLYTFMISHILSRIVTMNYKFYAMQNAF